MLELEQHYQLHKAVRQPSLCVYLSLLPSAKLTIHTSLGPLLTVAAPGQGLTPDPALHYLKEYRNTYSGTSFAAPFVSGLCAYYLAAPQFQDRFRDKKPGEIPGLVKGLVMELAYPRVEGGLPVAWNGMTSDQDSSASSSSSSSSSSLSIDAGSDPGTEKDGSSSLGDRCASWCEDNIKACVSRVSCTLKFCRSSVCRGCYSCPQDRIG